MRDTARGTLPRTTTPSMFNHQDFFTLERRAKQQRVAAIAGSALAAILLVTFATATDASRAVDSASLALVSADCAPVVRGRTIHVAWETTVAADENSVMVGSDDMFGTTVAATPGTRHAAVIADLPSGATVHYRVTSRRTATEETAASGTCVVTVDGLDTAAPRFTDVIVDSVVTDAAAVHFATNEPAALLVTVTSFDADGAIVTASETTATQDIVSPPAHRIVLSGLTPGTRYTVRADAIDNAGNSTTLTPPIEFRTLHVPAPVAQW
ncbi:MAG: hypothetical protein Q7T01_01430 [bacterium]|nr:hypothetical protein [bacterium]